jgi:hypothetical protein
MKISVNKLRELVREELRSAIYEKSQASEKAQQMGLDYYGFGRYGKDGKVTHKSKNDKLVPVESGTGNPSLFYRRDASDKNFDDSTPHRKLGGHVYTSNPNRITINRRAMLSSLVKNRGAGAARRIMHKLEKSYRRAANDVNIMYPNSFSLSSKENIGGVSPSVSTSTDAYDALYNLTRKYFDDENI